MGCYPHFILPMRSSRGFASTAANFVALFRLAFASAPCQRHLTLLVTVSRRIIMQKARRYPGTTPRRTLLAVSRSRRGGEILIPHTMT